MVAECFDVLLRDPVEADPFAYRSAQLGSGFQQLIHGLALLLLGLKLLAGNGKADLRFYGRIFSSLHAAEG